MKEKFKGKLAPPHSCSAATSWSLDNTASWSTPIAKSPLGGGDGDVSNVPDNWMQQINHLVHE